MTRVELFESIRRDHRLEGLSIRALASKYKVHRRLVRQALASAVPPPRKEPVRASPVTGQYQATIREWLVADQEVHKKQRHTAHRVWTRLVAEHGADVGVILKEAERRCALRGGDASGQRKRHEKTPEER